MFLMLLVLAISFLYPIFFLGINALKTKIEYRKDPFSLPASPNFSNFSLLIGNFKILDAFKNTFLIALGSVSIIGDRGHLRQLCLCQAPLQGAQLRVPGHHRHHVHPGTGDDDPAVLCDERAAPEQYAYFGDRDVCGHVPARHDSPDDHQLFRHQQTR